MLRQKLKQQYTEELNKTKIDQQNMDMENTFLKQKVADLEFQIEKIIAGTRPPPLEFISRFSIFDILSTALFNL